LFRFRFSLESSEDIRAFMKENKMNFQPVWQEIDHFHKIVFFKIYFSTDSRGRKKENFDKTCTCYSFQCQQSRCFGIL
jgi:hypothetical protein